MDTTTAATNGSDTPIESNQSPIYIAVFTLIFLVGTIANGLIVLLIIFVREFRNSSNVFILILCASNNVFLLIFLPIELFPAIQAIVIRSLFLSRFFQFTLMLFCAVSILSLVMLSYDRWRAVVRPLDIKSHTVRTTVARVATVLTLGVILALPSGFIHEDTGENTIPMNNDTLRGVTFYSMVTLYVCPLILIAFLYLSMAIKLLTQGKTIRESLRHHVKPRAQRSRVAWVVVGLVVSFAVCWFPFYLFLIIFVTTPTEQLEDHTLFMFLYDWRTLITNLNTCIDPLSIFLLGSRFRIQLWKIICCGLNVSKTGSRNREGAVTTTRRRTRSSSSSNSTTRTAFQLPLVSNNADQR